VYPQSNLKGQQGFSWLLQTKRKVRKPSVQEEQLQLLRQILAELQKLNASLASRAGTKVWQSRTGRHTILAMMSWKNTNSYSV
jgi:hypothetical protein